MAAFVFGDASAGAQSKTFERSNESLTAQGVAPEAVAARMADSGRLLVDGKAKEAEELVTRALADVATAADKANALTERGRLLYLANRGDLALADYERALQLDPGCRAALVYRARLWIDAGLYDRALAVLRTEGTPAPSPDEQALAGLALFLRGGETELEKAKRMIVAASSRTEAPNYDLLMAHGEVDLATAVTSVYSEGYIKTANEEFEAAAALAPDRDEPQEAHDRAGKFIVTGKLPKLPRPKPEAVALVGGPAEKPAPANESASDGPTGELRAVAEAAFQAGEFQRAADAAEQALKANPSDRAGVQLLARIQLAWANAFAAQDNAMEARRKLGEAYATTRDAEMRRQIQAMITSMVEKMEEALRARDMARALTLAEAELAANRYDQRAHLVRAAVYESRSEWPEVVRAYTAAIVTWTSGARMKPEQLKLARTIIITFHLPEVRRHLQNRQPVRDELKRWIVAIGEITESPNPEAGDYRSLARLYFLDRQWDRAAEAMTEAVAAADAEQRPEFAREAGALTTDIGEAKRVGNFFPEYLRWRENYVAMVNHFTRGESGWRDPEFESALPRELLTRLNSLRAAAAARTRTLDALAEVRRIFDKAEAAIHSAPTPEERNDARNRALSMEPKNRALNDELEVDEQRYRILLEGFWN